MNPVADQLLSTLQPVKSCHLCQSSSPADKRILGNRGVATHDAFDGDRSPAWVQADVVKAVECRRCGLIYTDPMPDLSQVDLDKLYGVNYFPSEKTVRPDHARLEGILRQCGWQGQTDYAYLEVGFGEGELLLAAHEKGLKATGIEVSSKLRDDVARVNPAVTTFVGDFPTLDLPNGAFDLVMMNQVLEHVPEPRVYLQTIHRLLKPGGVAYVSVPNEGSLFYMAASAFKRWKDGSTYHLAPLYSPYHIYGFTRRSLTTLLEQEGFRVTLFDAHFVGVSTGTQGLRRTVENAIFQLEGFLNMGSCMALVARKP